MKKYVTTKKECLKKIKGVCEGCGGKLEPIETVDNANNPTFWVGCFHCNCFRAGIDKIYFEIARELVKKDTIIPYSSRNKFDYKDNSERLEYWLDTQTAGLSHIILEIDEMLKEKKEVKILR